MAKTGRDGSKQVDSAKPYIRDILSNFAAQGCQLFSNEESLGLVTLRDLPRNGFCIL
jgi:hypothetical protein